jgi:arsenite methyltransferase
LQPGETVLDLGSGGGLDCFLAARQVGETGHVIGVDMTPDMLAKARGHAARLKVSNVEFREGYLEALPIDDATIDVVISNCVINLSPDKPQVFREVFRALKPGGRVAVSDIVTNGSLPAAVQKSMEAWGACVAGALDMREYVRGLSEAGFGRVRVQPKSTADQMLAGLPIGVPFSATITAYKPAGDEHPVEEATADLEPTGINQIDLPAGDLDRMLSHVVEMQSLDDGYDFRVAGDPAEIRSVVEAIRAQISCCSPLQVNLVEASDGAHVRITAEAASQVIAVSDIK